MKAKNLSGFGYVGDQNELAPKQMVGSLVYYLYPVFKKIVQDVANGTYKGQDYDLGLASFKLVLNPKYVGREDPGVVAREDEGGPGEDPRREADGAVRHEVEPPSRRGRRAPPRRGRSNRREGER